MVFVGQVADVSSLLPATCLQVDGVWWCGSSDNIAISGEDWMGKRSTMYERSEWLVLVLYSAVGIMVGVIASKKSNAYTCKYEMTAITEWKH